MKLKMGAAAAALAAGVLLIAGCGAANGSDADKAVEQCKQAVLDQAKDPDSAKFSEVTVGQPSKTSVIRSSGSPLEEVTEWRGGGTVNAKNSYGGYGGPRTFTCYATKYGDGTWSGSADVKE